MFPGKRLQIIRLISPSRKCGVVVMCNSEYASPDPIAAALFKLLESSAR